MIIKILLTGLLFCLVSCGNTTNKAPEITIISPANGATVSGSLVRIEASMTDDHDLKAYFYFYIDNNHIGGGAYANIYYDWDTTDGSKTYNANGPHIIKIVAVDSWGLSSEKTITVTISN